MRSSYSVVGGVLGAVVVTAVWWLASQRHATPVSELGELSSSPLCLTAAGTPRAGSPTVSEAWTRLMRRPLAQSTPLYLGNQTVELHGSYRSEAISVGFVHTGAHSWRPAQDPYTTTWVAAACRLS